MHRLGSCASPPLALPAALAHVDQGQQAALPGHVMSRANWRHAHLTCFHSAPSPAAAIGHECSHWLLQCLLRGSICKQGMEDTAIRGSTWSANLHTVRGILRMYACAPCAHGAEARLLHQARSASADENKTLLLQNHCDCTAAG